MSDDEEEKKPKLRIVKDEPHTTAKPKPLALVSAETAKQLFMASPHLEWTTWAKSMNWGRLRRPAMYDDFPEWQKEKREILAREQAESISEALFSHQGRWHADVLKTMKEYPEAPDALLLIMKKRISDIVSTINEDERVKARAQHTGEEFVSKFSEIKTSELTSLALGIKVVTEAKHKALMIDSWSLRVAETFTDPSRYEAPKAEDQQWRVKLTNGRELDDASMQKLMTSYYDVPGEERRIERESDEDQELETT